MKKRLLITSIVMMLVCAVALSTATYAWFTSNTTVSASVVTLKAATSDKSALGIGWTDGKAGTFITSAINAILEPMAPEIHNASGQVVALEDGVSTYERQSGGNQLFYTSNIKQEGSFIEFSNTALKKNPAVYTENAADATSDQMSFLPGQSGPDGKRYHNSFYVVNMSTANVLDTVVVSGVFTDEASTGTYRYMIANTNMAPDLAHVTYFLKTGSGTDPYVEITNGSDDYIYLQNHGFDNEKTYYVRESRYVVTEDTKFKEDTDYWTYNGTTYTKAYVVGDPIPTGTVTIYEKVNSSFTQTSDTVFASGKQYYNGMTEDNKVVTVEVGADITDRDGFSDGQEKYWELRDKNGDDMIRVAIFKKEYRYTADTKVQNDKDYYRIDPSTGILGKVTGLTVGNDIEGKLLELNSDKHTLVGVIGKNHTVFTSAQGTTYDMNEVYYTAGEMASVAVSEGTFADLKDVLFTYDGSQYKAISSENHNNTYDPNATYYKQTYTKVVSSDPDQIDNYYTASTTVVNGKININDKVKDMNYYTNVNKSIDLAINLKPGEVVDIIAVIWLDGTDLDDTRSDEYAQVSLKFDSFRTNHSSQNAQH